MLPYSRAMIRAIGRLAGARVAGEHDVQAGVDLGQARLAAFRVEQLDGDQPPDRGLDRDEADERVELGQDLPRSSPSRSGVGGGVRRRGRRRRGVGRRVAVAPAAHRSGRRLAVGRWRPRPRRPGASRAAEVEHRGLRRRLVGDRRRARSRPPRSRSASRTTSRPGRGTTWRSRAGPRSGPPARARRPAPRARAAARPPGASTPWRWRSPRRAPGRGSLVRIRVALAAEPVVDDLVEVVGRVHHRPDRGHQLGRVEVVTQDRVVELEEAGPRLLVLDDRDRPEPELLALDGRPVEQLLGRLDVATERRPDVDERPGIAVLVGRPGLDLDERRRCSRPRG